MQTFFVSLTGPLLGCYLQVEAKDERQVRLAMLHSQLNKLWCSVYDKPYEGGLRPPTIIPTRLEELPDNWHEYSMQLEADEVQPIW